VVVDSFNLTLTTHTLDRLPVRAGKASVTMVSYESPENFSSSYLGERDLDEFSSVRYQENTSQANISMLKFDIDVVDEERGHLGRATNYALGVPFLVNVSCERIMKRLHGHLLCGPFLPGEEMNVTVSTLPEIGNVTLELYESSQFQGLVFGNEEPLHTHELALTAGTGAGEVPAPGANGSYLLLARGTRAGTTGNESLGFVTLQVQEFETRVTLPADIQRNQEMTILILPDTNIDDAAMMVSIASADGVILLPDSQASLGEEGYELRFTVPLYAANGSYHVVAYYTGEDVFDVYSVGIAIFNVTGGPTTPPFPDQPPNDPPDGDGFRMLCLFSIILLAFGFLLLMGAGWMKTRMHSLDPDKIDRGGSENLEKETEDGKNPHPDREQEKEEDEG